MAGSELQFDAWNPGLDSVIPARLMPLATLFRPENSSVGYAEARELADICGLKPQDMVAFNARRLVVHELLIRVTADLHVPDGPNYEDLGIQLRGMTARIRDAYVEPKMDEIERAFADLRNDVEVRLEALLDRDVFADSSPAPSTGPGLFARVFGRKKHLPSAEPRPDLGALAKWETAIERSEDPFETACLKGLHKIVSGIVGRRGRLMADKDVIVRLASNWICNSYGSERIGEMLEPFIDAAVGKEGYKRLPAQKAPVILNVKGASAAGKSSIRPLQRKLAQRIGVPWEQFALVSPDYWRKFLLDYNSLGDDFKYAAMLTGQELEIIDKKLDGYMERKAARSEMPHLLIDRFRFDSFELGSIQPADRRLLSRFGDTVYMFFVITPPAETVERAWTRGIETGRYKAVDDLLYHNIEAYTGMPNLFFNWVKRDKQIIHFEFLDNSIPYGETPRSVAFGWNNSMVIIDIECMRKLNIYKNVNINARSPDETILKTSKPQRDFILDCIDKIPDVTFVDPDSLEVVGHTRNGKCDYEADGFFEKSSIDVECAGPDGETRDRAQSKFDNTVLPNLDFDYERKFTVGAWGR